MIPICFVFGAGPPPDDPPEIAEQDFVIAADGGYLYTKNAGIQARIVIGDFDSLGSDLSGALAGDADSNPGNGPSGNLGSGPGGDTGDVCTGDPLNDKDNPLVVSLPKEKDQTDTLAALKCGLEHGFKRFHIYGGAGGRLDHTLANIQCLRYLLNHGARGYLYDRDVIVTALRTGVWLAPLEEGIISVFALGGPASGVCLRGLKYELENTHLNSDYPLGVSNEFIGRPAYIGTEHGDLLVIYPTGTTEIEGEFLNG